MPLSSSIETDETNVHNHVQSVRYVDSQSQGVQVFSVPTTSSLPEGQISFQQVESITVDDSPRIFALIIGINKYLSPDIENIWGAVADAKVIRDFLREKLCVDKRRIHMLTNSKATRQNIIQGFRSLQNNNDIRKGDAILVYYAGHGQEVEAPSGWATEDCFNTVQSIVPHDFSSDGNVHVIPDRTIGHLLSDIMTAKGDNITVIFDCCHSGSGTRNITNPHALVRSAFLKNYAIPIELDDDITQRHWERAAAQPTEQPPGSLLSHVFLAACSAYEQALEIRGRGQFTVALAKVLNSAPLSQMSYVDLMDRLEQIVGQNPQLEGINRHRMVFNGKAVPRTRDLYKVDITPSGQLVLHAGAAHGVGIKAEFTLYTDKTAYHANKSFGVYTVQHIEPFTSILSNPISLSNASQTPETSMIAVQTRVGVQEELRIHVPAEEGLLPVFEKLLVQISQSSESARAQLRFALVDRSAADLEVKRDADDIVFGHLDKRVTSHGLTRCIFKVSPEPADMYKVVQGAAHYYYHLNRSYLTSENLRDSLTIEFVKLHATWNSDDFGRPDWMPVGPNLIEDGMVNIDIDEDGENLYGIRITNNGDLDLYPNIFYFDNSELSISSYYLCGEQQQFTTDSPLQRDGGTLNLGFGNGGYSPFEYYLPEDQDVDVGFLKFFFSTSPVDLSSIAQQTPFRTLRDCETGIQYHNANNPDAWYSVLVPIVQRKASSK